MCPSAVRGAGKPFATSGPPSLPCALNIAAAASKSENPRTILLGRLQAHERAVVFIGQDIYQTVRSLAHIANPLLEIRKQRLPAGLIPILVEDNPLQMTDTLHRATK